MGGVRSECVCARKIQTNVLSCSGVNRGTQHVKEKKKTGYFLVYKHLFS